MARDVFDAMYDMLSEHEAQHGPGIAREYRAAPDAYDAIQAAARKRWPQIGRGDLTTFQDVPIVYDLRLDAGIVYVQGERCAQYMTGSLYLTGVYLGELDGPIVLHPPKIL